jgi:maleylacetate reductase
VLALNSAGAPDAAARIGRALGSGHPAAALQQLSARLGLPRSLSDVGLREDQLDEAARLIEPVVPGDNPVPVDVAVLGVLLRAAWAGDAVNGPAHHRPPEIPVQETT